MTPRNRTFVAVGLLGLLVAAIPSPEIRSTGAALSSPGADFWFGSDALGRSVALKLWAGLRTALLYAVLGSGISVALGTMFGAIAGRFGGSVDDLISGLTAATSSIPKALLLTALGFLLGRGTFTSCLAIGLSTWAGVARLVRIETMRLQQAEFVTSAQALGAGPFRILWNHILPGLSPLLAAEFLAHGAYAVKAEVWLTYLGLTSSSRPSWGEMIVDSKEALLRNAWWELAAATAAMFFLLLAIERGSRFFFTEERELRLESEDELSSTVALRVEGHRRKEPDQA